MRTNIDIDDQLMANAMEAGGFKTKKDAVEEGLRLLARRKTYDGLLALRGKLVWEGDANGSATRPPLVAEQSSNYKVAKPAASKAGTQTKGKKAVGKTTVAKKASK